jgi:iron complex outermembrane recepter protein
MGIRFRVTGAALALTALLAQAASAQDSPQDGKLILPTIDVSSSRLGAGIVGTSTSVITAEDIRRAPAQTLPDILSREPGIQVTNLFGGVNGARSAVDMRGFGAAAGSNTLILIDGRRITDLDLTGVDLASIPRESIERIEITRGNSGVVLYGDGAVGGVINIVTKSAAGSPPSARVETGFGSFKQREGAASAGGSNGPWSASLYGNGVNSDGYRVNNFYRQANGTGDFRYTVPDGSFYLKLSGDGQYIGLPGARRVDPVAGLDQLTTDRTGATTPYDHSQKDGANATAGITRLLAPGAELIVDGGIRYKREQAQFYNATATVATSDPNKAVDTMLTTTSFTPRVKLDSLFGTLPWNAIGGIDYYRAVYGSDRPLYLGAPPIDRYDLTQSSLGLYWQQTLSVLPSTDISAGGRIQRVTVSARDKFDINAPGGQQCFIDFGCFPANVEGLPFDTTETHRAFHLGLDQRFNENIAVFGRWAESFRVPNVDERVGVVTVGNGVPTTFDLRTQRSHDWEAGTRLHFGRLDIQSSIYDMMLTDEIHFRYGPNFEANNINLDPTRRYGNETIASYRVSDELRFKAGAAYTRSVFRQGLFAGNDVPLVSRWTGNAGVSWNIWQKWLVFDGVVRLVGSRRMDNDQTNVQPKIPASTTVDVRLGGEIEKIFWSFAIQNLLNVSYFDYAIASPYPYGPGSQLNTYNAYPLQGRSYMLKVGMTY